MVDWQAMHDEVVRKNMTLASENRTLEARCTELSDELSTAYKDRNHAERKLHEFLRDRMEREPDYVYDPKNWEYTCAWGDRYILTEDLGFGEIMEMHTLVSSGSKFAARVPVSFDEDGNVEDDEAQWFDSREEAEAALLAGSRANEKPPKP